MSHALQSPQKEANLIPIKSLDGGNVSERLEKIKHASEGWKKRVGMYTTICKNYFQNLNRLFSFKEQSDATQFTVAGRLQAKPLVQLQFNKSEVKMTPPKTVLRSLNQPQLGLAKSPSMMVSTMISENSDQLPTEKLSALTRSISVPGVGAADHNDEDASRSKGEPTVLPKSAASTIDKKGLTGSKVAVPRVDDDETFMNFFTSVQKTVIEEGVEIADFDVIKSTER